MYINFSLILMCNLTLCHFRSLLCLCCCYTRFSVSVNCTFQVLNHKNNARSEHTTSWCVHILVLGLFVFSVCVYIKEKNFKPLFSPHVVSCFMDPLELERP